MQCVDFIRIFCILIHSSFNYNSPPTPSRKYYPIPMPLSKPGKDLATALALPVTLIPACSFCYGYISMLHLLFHVSLPLDFFFFCFLFDPFPTICNPLIQLRPPSPNSRSAPFPPIFLAIGAKIIRSVRYQPRPHP